MLCAILYVLLCAVSLLAVLYGPMATGLVVVIFATCGMVLHSYMRWFPIHRVHVLVSVGQVASSPPVILNALVNSIQLDFEMVNCASVTVIPYSVFSQLFPDAHVKESSLVLQAISGNIQTAGEVIVLVDFNNKIHKLPIVLSADTPNFMPLMGRNWLDVLMPQWRSIFQGTVHTMLSQQSFAQVDRDCLAIFDSVTEFRKFLEEL